MKLDTAGKQHLTNEEGVRLHAYKDIKGIWTIGTGNTYYEDGSPVKEGDVITKERVPTLLNITARDYENNINAVVKVPLNQNQFNALVEFSYNVGINGFNKSTLLKKLNAKDYIGAADQFLAWIKQPSLLTRRKRTRALFLL